MRYRISQRLPLVVLVLAFAAAMATLLGADSIGINNQIRDQETGALAVLKLHDNGDGTKSPVVFAVIVTPTPTATATATATSTPTPTPG